jgi:hypothetical protein
MVITEATTMLLATSQRTALCAALVRCAAPMPMPMKVWRVETGTPRPAAMNRVIALRPSPRKRPAWASAHHSRMAQHLEEALLARQQAAGSGEHAAIGRCVGLYPAARRRPSRDP